MTDKTHDIAINDTEAGDEEQSSASSALFTGDTGTLAERSRRALLELVRGPYLSQTRSAQNWSALLADETAIRSRLHDMLLDLVIDPQREFAFVRNVEATDAALPRAVRTEALTFLDTAMLLALRHTLLTEEGRGRVIVGQDELYETLQVYRTGDRDETDFRKRLNASWAKMMNKLRVIHAVDEGRAEISPVVRMIVDADQVRALQGVYDRIARGDSAGDDGRDAGDLDDDESTDLDGRVPDAADVSDSDSDSREGIA